MRITQVIREVLSPGRAEFRAHLTRVTEEQARLLSCLHSLEKPVTAEIRGSTAEASEFEPR